MKITVDRLIELNACQDRVDWFKSTFGEEVEVTEANCLKALESDTRWDSNIKWLVDKMLPLSAQIKYNEAFGVILIEYTKAVNDVWDKYNRATNSAWNKFLKVIISSNKEEIEKMRIEYKKDIIPAQIERDMAIDSSIDSFYRRMILLFNTVVSEIRKGNE